MKRIIICFDGTWNRIDADEPTNVLKIATGITPKSQNEIGQIIYYDEGVGTSGSWIRRLKDGAFGLGVRKNLREAYQFLMFNYDPQDEIYVFGFSRGAFTARSFVGLIRSVGIIQRDQVRQVPAAIKIYKKGLGFAHPDLLAFRAKYSRHISTCGEDEQHRCEVLEDYLPGSSLPFKFRYVGIWDTVESIGFWKILWASLTKRKQTVFVDSHHKYHDHKLNGMVAAGRHAVALDEKRQHFHSEPWGAVSKRNTQLGYDINDENRPIQEKFFPGDHGSVGGGGDIKGLSDGAFEWVLDGARNAGLKLDVTATSSIYNILPNHQASLRNTTKPPKKFSLINIFQQTRSHKPNGMYEIHDSAQRRWLSGGLGGKAYRPEALMHLRDQLDNANPAKLKEYKALSGKIEQNLDGGEFIYHTIKKDESLSAIAETYLGDRMRFDEIFELNRQIIHDKNKVYPGQVIRVPISKEDE